MEGLDVGYTVGLHVAALRQVTLGTRLGVFSDHGSTTGGSRGFFGGLVLQGRTGQLELAEIGSQDHPGIIGMDLTVEAIGYGSANSPLPQGTAWGAISILPGFRFGGDEGVRYGLVAGPTWYFGETNSLRAFIGLRLDFQLSSHPHP